MPTPPPFPFHRTGRVIYSSRGLYGWAALIVVIIALLGTVVWAYSGNNTPTTVVIACCFLGVLLALAGWCMYFGRRVQLWEREYERVMGQRFGA